MALTTQERNNIIKLMVGMFDAAPGATYLADLENAYEGNGRSLLNLAKDLANTGAYKALNPVFQTAAEFAQSLLTPLGLEQNVTALEFVTSQFNAGVSKGQIAYAALIALDASTDAAFADAKAILNNKTTVAVYYSVDLHVAQTNVATLHLVLAEVTKDPASVMTAERAIDALLHPPPVTTGGATGGTTGTGTAGGGTGTGAGTSTTGTTGTGTGTTTGAPPPAPDYDGGSDPATTSPPGSGGSGDSMPGWDSEHMGPPPPDPGGPVLVWDPDLGAWVPALGIDSRPESLGRFDGTDAATLASVTLVGLAAVEPFGPVDPGVGWAV